MRFSYRNALPATVYIPIRREANRFYAEGPPFPAAFPADLLRFSLGSSTARGDADARQRAFLHRRGARAA